MDLNKPAGFAQLKSDDVNEYNGDLKGTPATMHTSKNVWLTVEAATAGLAFGSVLWWASTCLVGAFRPEDLADPYWDGLPWLRTDTSGFAAFLVAALTLTCSEYLRLRRRHEDRRRALAPSSVATTDKKPGDAPVLFLLLATSEAVIILATGLMCYLSLNTITHPGSLQIQATHLLQWPTESTLRIIALVLCVCSVAIFRYIRPLASRS
jgi:hypothetical protein